jgi:hypothetical protein
MQRRPADSVAGADPEAAAPVDPEAPEAVVAAAAERWGWGREEEEGAGWPLRTPNADSALPSV